MAKEKYTDTLPDGSIIDLDAYDWGGVKLLKRQKLLIIWYTTPGQNGYKNPTVAAQKAGYSIKTSYVAKHKLIRECPTVVNLIKKFTDEQIKVSVKDAVDKLITQKISRATYNIKDFYTNTEIENPETGATRQITSVIPLEELDREKAAIIDNIEINNVGITTYKLPNREKETNDLIKLNEQLNGNANSNEYDVETTLDVIKENFASVKTTIKLRNQEIREAAGEYIETNENQPDYD